VELWTKCIIIEDDELALKLIQSNLRALGVNSKIYTFTSVIEAMKHVTFEPTDLLFLDIGLPGMSGIEFAKSLSIRPNIVIITSERDYAFDAFQIDVIDYILKPVDQSKLLRSLTKVNEVLRKKQRGLHQSSQKVFIRHKRQHVSVASDSILWVEAQGDYATIQTTDKRYTIKKTLTNMEGQLMSENFMRVHRSFIVNMDTVDKIDECNLIIQNTLIPVSRARKAEVLNYFKLLD